MDTTEECLCCGREFDSDNDGHVDCNTGMAFCSPWCENHYDRDTGLPHRYELPPGYEGNDNA